MKTIAVFFSKPGTDDYPFDKDYYRIAYKELGEEIAKRGARLCVVRDERTYKGGNTFQGYWEFDGQWFMRKEDELRADVLYIKSSTFNGTAGATFLNSPGLDEFCTDKWKTYQVFNTHQTPTFKVESPGDVADVVQDIRGEKIVAKPVDGEEGVGVFVLKPEDVIREVTTFPYLLQEFIDTSKGIPGLVESTHDFRIISMNGEPVLAFIRTPPQGSYLANVARGGHKIEVNLDDIPLDALRLQKIVDEYMKQFGSRVYSLDIGLDADGAWKIIELNAKPGCTCKSEGPGSIRFQERLADALIAACNA